VETDPYFPTTSAIDLPSQLVKASKQKIYVRAAFRALRDFRLLPQSRVDLRSYGILRSAEWQFHTDVSGQPIGPIFKGPEVLLGHLDPLIWDR
jgi:hypothetical protein